MHCNPTDMLTWSLNRILASSGMMSQSILAGGRMVVKVMMICSLLYLTSLLANTRGGANKSILEMGRVCAKFQRWRRRMVRRFVLCRRGIRQVFT